MSCSTGCPTPGAHKTWGECLRAKNTRVAWAASARGLDLTTEKKWDKELSDYRDARAQGVQPGGTTGAKVQEAMQVSQETGRAFDASRPVATALGIEGVD